MNFRLMFIIVLLLIAPVLYANTAYADAVTTLYTETGLNNREMMRWELTCNMLAVCVGAPGPAPAFVQTAWESSVGKGVRDGMDVLVFKSQHLLGPHLNIDADPGQGVTLVVTFADLNNLLNPPNIFNRVGLPFTVLHPALFQDHADIYDLLVRKNAAGGFDFIFASSHVPEPTTLLLLSTGLAGAAIKARKRLKRRKSG